MYGGKENKRNKLRNSKIRQITYVLYMFNELVTSDGVRESVTFKINDFFFNRIPEHKDYYKNNSLLKSIYYYFQKIIEANYKIAKKQ